FFQAEDGIRDFHVTGVQTCALPILVERAPAAANQDPNGGGAFNYGGNPSNNRIENTGLTDDQYFTARWEGTITIPATGTYTFAKIGRASCREREQVEGGRRLIKEKR